MKKSNKVAALLLAGTLVLGAALTGCSDAEESTKTATGSVLAQKGTEGSAEQQATGATQRSDGSKLAGDTYYDEPFGLTVTLPKGWADGVYIHNNETPSGKRELAFIEKTNYDKDKSKGVLFTITAETEEPADGSESMGSISTEASGRIYLKYYEPSKPNCVSKSKKLSANYAKLAKLTSKAVKSIVVDSDEDYTPPASDGGITLKISE